MQIGERGPMGDRGALGPDGPRGHEGHEGQVGEQGPRGPRGYVDLPPGLILKIIGLPIAVSFIVAAVMAFGTARAALEKSCERNVADRAEEIKSEWSGAAANQLVADDPTQSAVTRAARREQAATQRASVRSVELRVPRKYRVTPEGRRAKQFQCPGIMP